MRYASASAFSMALVQRLSARANESQTSIDRLRRRVLLETLLRRLDQAEPGQWVLKGGMALEVRLREHARRTVDIDLGLRRKTTDPTGLRARIIDALSVDRDGDFFAFELGEPQEMATDVEDQPTWRFLVTGRLAGKVFATVKLDVSPRPDELREVEQFTLNSLSFAGISEYAVEVIDIHRHIAEKFHAMTRPRETGPNSRVRDLVDIVLLHEHGLVDPERAAAATREVFQQCATHSLPPTLDDAPVAWADGYERLVQDLQIATRTLPEALAIARAIWARMFPTR